MLVTSTPTVGHVHVRLGPLASASAQSWIGYAEQVLSAVPTEAGSDGVWLPADAVAGFEQYLGQWSLAAERGPVFTWEGEIPREEAEYLFHAFFRVATHLSAQAEASEPMAPAASEAFYRALVAGLLAALDHEGDATSEFSEHLRSFWPGLET
jgi:hypothetical protein